MEEKEGLKYVLSRIEELKDLIKDNRKAARIVEEIEEFLSSGERLAFEALKEATKGRSREELAEMAENMRRDEDVGNFLDIASSIREGNGKLSTVLFMAWVIAAAVFFIMSIYFFFPPYVLFTEMRGNITMIQKTLEMVYMKPEILRAADFLFKLLGLMMLAMAIASMYQAHILMERTRGGGA